MELLRDRYRLARWIDEVLAAVFAAAFAAMTILAPRHVGSPDSRWQGYSLYITAAGWLLVLLFLVRIVASTYSRRDTPSPITLRTFFLDRSKLLRIQGRDPGWLPVRYAVLSVPILLLGMGFPVMGREVAQTDKLEVLAVADVHAAARKPELRAAWEGSRIRVVGRIKGIGADQRLVLFEYENGRLFHIDLGSIVHVLIDNSSRLGLNPWGWKLPNPATRVEVIGTLGFREIVDNPTEFAPVLTVTTSETTPLNELIKPLESKLDP